VVEEVVEPQVQVLSVQPQEELEEVQEPHPYPLKEEMEVQGQLCKQRVKLEDKQKEVVPEELDMQVQHFQLRYQVEVLCMVVAVEDVEQDIIVEQFNREEQVEFQDRILQVVEEL
jgi:hypothetical protein